MSLPSSDLIPTLAPKSNPFGYAEINASGKTTSSAFLSFAFLVNFSTLSIVESRSKTIGLS